MRTVTFGEMLLRLQAPGHERLLRSPGLEAVFGGSEINVAVALSHLGADSEVVTLLPRNAVGDRAAETLRAHQVQLNGARIDGRLGLYFAERGRPPRAAEVLYDRHPSVFSEHQDWSNTVRWHDLLAGARWFHTSGITPPLSKHAHRAVADALEAARTIGVRTSFDLNYRGALWPSETAAGTSLRPLLEGVELLVANTFHLEQCFGLSVRADDETELAERLAAACGDLGVRSLALSQRQEQEDGSQSWSALLFRDGQVRQSPKWRLLPVERIGGGDAFTAGLLLAIGEGLEDAVGFAAACGALKLAEPGDWCTASRDQVERVLGGATTGIRR